MATEASVRKRLRSARRKTVALLVVLALFGAPVSADDLVRPDDESDLEWRLENVRVRLTVFEQEGSGYQSQGTPDPHERGDEQALIFQPIIAFRLRQNADITHDVTMPIDIVSAASPDAIDAITTASRENEAGSFDVVTSIRTAPSDTLTLHWGTHFEEYWGTGFLGAAIKRSFADDNATFRTGFEVLVDSFDAITFQGVDPGPVDHRLTVSLSSSLSQILTPTTIVSGSYTYTSQTGRLETTYNSVPLEGGDRTSELYPRTRSRHTFAAEMRQAILETNTFLSLSYRFYLDSFDANAHTAQAEVTQYLWDFWVRGHYRFHHQEAPYFWTSLVPMSAPENAPRTGDSDLEQLDAQELGFTLRWFFQRAGAITASDAFIQLGYSYYWRSNSLLSHVASIDFGKGF